MLNCKAACAVSSVGACILGNYAVCLCTATTEKLSPSGPPWLSGMIFALPGLAFVLSAYPWNRLGERFSYARVALWGLWGACGFLLFSSLMNNIGKFSLLYLVYGVFLAAITPSAASIIARQVNEEFRGRAYGIQQAVTNLGGLLAPIMAGAAASNWGTVCSILEQFGCGFCPDLPPLVLE